MGKGKKYFILSLLFLAPLFIFSHCQGLKREKLEDFLYLRLNSNPTTLDPALIVDVSGANLATKLFNGLVRFDPDLNIVPDIAQSWTISLDQRTYLFKLKSPVRFSNGRLVTAWDFKYSLERVLDPRTASPRTWVLESILGAQDYLQGKSSEVKGIEVLDDLTLKVKLKEPFSPFLHLLALPTAYVVPREEVIKKGKDFSFQVVGSGPFILQEWRPNQFLKLMINPNYFDQKPELKGIIYRIIPEDLTALVEFEEGNLDAFGLPQAEFQRYINNPKWKNYIISQGGLNVYYLGLNCQKPPFTHLLVRKALNYAIDRRKILDTLLEGRGILASGPLPPLLRKNRTEVLDPYPYNPVKARELLSQAGYPSGFKMQIYLSSEQESLDILEVVQGYLEKVGIKTKLIPLEWSSFKAALDRGEADAFWLSWWADYPDPENFLFPSFHSSNWGAGGNRARFKDPEIDQLLEKAQRSKEKRRRDELYALIEKKVVDKAPWVFFWHRKEFLIHQPWVINLKPHLLPQGDKGTEVTLKK